MFDVMLGAGKSGQENSLGVIVGESRYFLFTFAMLAHAPECPVSTGKCVVSPRGRNREAGEGSRVCAGGASCAREACADRARRVNSDIGELGVPTPISLSGGVTRYVWAGGTPDRLGGERGGLPLARTAMRRTCHSAALCPGVSGGCCRAHAEGRNYTLRPTRRILNPAQRTR